MRGIPLKYAGYNLIERIILWDIQVKIMLLTQ